MKLPIKVTLGHQWRIDGYQFLYQRGGIAWGSFPLNGGSCADTGGVKFQVWVAEWVIRLLQAPERLWRRILCYLWLDRLAFQYERGYADGIREALANHAHYASLTPEELDAIVAQPASQQGY